MPTRGNLEKLEALQNAAAGLVDIKRTVDRVEQDIRMLKARLSGSEPLDEASMGDISMSGVFPEDSSVSAKTLSDGIAPLT